MAQGKIISTQSIWATTVLAIVMVLATFPAGAQTSAASDDRSAPAVTPNTCTSGASLPTAVFGPPLHALSVAEASPIQTKSQKTTLRACSAAQNQRRVTAATSAGSGSSLAVKCRRNGAS